jgi:hypothetical protein
MARRVDVLRNTDPKKWGKVSFRRLSLEAKVVWSYLCDSCNIVGIWQVDHGLAAFQIGISEDQVTKALADLGDKIEMFGENYLIIPDFINFQYRTQDNTLNPAYDWHRSVISACEKWGVKYQTRDSLNPLSSQNGTSYKGKGKGKGRGSVREIRPKFQPPTVQQVLAHLKEKTPRRSSPITKPRAG